MEGYSMRRRVFEQIRDDILKGKYKEHEELREIALGKELGVSRTPVREALRQLELEGLVAIVPNKGAYVTGISHKDVEDIYCIRSMLEGLCARWAVENITDQQVEELDEVLMLSEYHLEKGDTDKVTELDSRFHKILYEASNSRILEHTLSDFHKYVKLARRISMEKESRAKESAKEHRKLLDAIRSRDADQAEKLANAHVMHVMKNLHIQEEKKNGKN